MKKHQSAEQIAAREAKRAKVKAFAAELGKMTADQRAEIAARYPIMTIEGRPLSVFNQCLIARQNPAASVVGGFRQWINSGRAVTKGQSGLIIWVPIGIAKDNDNGSESDEGSSVRFILGTVFDVSQTQEIETAELQEAA